MLFLNNSVLEIVKMEEIDESLEGFLCPVCRFNFKTDGQLLAHYQDKHSDDFFKSVKGTSE